MARPSSIFAAVACAVILALAASVGPAAAVPATLTALSARSHASVRSQHRLHASVDLDSDLHALADPVPVQQGAEGAPPTPAGATQTQTQPAPAPTQQAPTQTTTQAPASTQTQQAPTQAPAPTQTQQAPAPAPAPTQTQQAPIQAPAPTQQAPTQAPTQGTQAPAQAPTTQQAAAQQPTSESRPPTQQQPLQQDPKDLPPSQRPVQRQQERVKALAEHDECTSTALCGDVTERTLNVLTFNILSDLGYCPFNKTVCIDRIAEMIAEYQVDVAAIQEIDVRKFPKSILDDVVTSLKERFGLVYQAVPNTEFVTRLPYKVAHPWGTSARSSGTLLQLGKNAYAWFWSVHLTAYPYGPYLLRDGKDVPTVLKLMRAVQLNDAKVLLDRVWDSSMKLEKVTANSGPAGEKASTDNFDPAPDAEYAKHGDWPVKPRNYPVFIMGDFNSPSHLDHTVDAATNDAYTAHRGHACAAMDWPLSMYMEENGYRDVYREAFPKSTEHPGFTWTPMPSKREVHDRIDYVYMNEYSPTYSREKERKQFALKTVQALRVEPLAQESKSKPVAVFSDHRAVFARIHVNWSPDVQNAVHRFHGGHDHSDDETEGNEDHHHHHSRRWRALHEGALPDYLDQFEPRPAPSQAQQAPANPPPPTQQAPTQQAPTQQAPAQQQAAATL